MVRSFFAIQLKSNTFGNDCNKKIRLYCAHHQCRHPLHLACLCHCPSTIASTVLNAYPEAAAIADSSEFQYPLHIAALHGANGTLLQRLYNCYPDAIRARTKSHGWLPLHLACNNDATPGAVRVLLQYYPESAKVRLAFCFLP